ncbi:MAG: hypothetical protein Q8P67_00610 [archaeon]|nr:hypothetical protein [archaeon]
MTIEAAWHCFSFVTMFVTAPAALCCIIGLDPFGKNGWITRYDRSAAERGNPRRVPVGIPVYGWAIAWAIVAAMLAVPSYVIYHNNGAELVPGVPITGWDANPIPLLWACTTVSLNVIWMLIYFTDCGLCANLELLQFPAIVTSAFTLYTFVNNNNTPSLWWMSIPMLVFTVLATVKTAFEGQACPGGLNIKTSCTTTILGIPMPISP